MCEEGVDIYKVCKPTACTFMKKLTHLQWFKYLANCVKINILRSSLECLHMVFVSFFSATISQYKLLKILFKIKPWKELKGFFSIFFLFFIFYFSSLISFSLSIHSFVMLNENQFIGIFLFQCGVFCLRAFLFDGTFLVLLLHLYKM